MKTHRSLRRIVEKFLVAIAVLALFASCGRAPDPAAGYVFDQTTHLFNLAPELITIPGAPEREIGDYTEKGERSTSLLNRGGARRALLIAPGEEVVFDSAVRPSSALYFDLGWPAEAPETGTLLARVVVRGDDGVEVEVWKRPISVPPSPEAYRWSRHEAQISASLTGDLVLSTHFEGNEGAPEDLALLWSEPILKTAGATVRPERDPPECVVVFLIDTLRADHLTAYGYPLETSPAITALAEESVLFTQTTAAASWTKPSVASLFTSRFPPQHGAEIYMDRMRDSETTLAEVLGAAGYTTAAIGQNIWVFGDRFNVTQGFEYQVPVWHLHGTTKQRADKVVDQALDWLTRHSSEPFFLYVQVFQPHAPHVPPDDHRARWVSEEYAGVLDGSLGGPGSHSTLTAEEVSDEDLAHVVSLYDAEVAFADQQVDRIVRHLKALGLWNNGTFVLAADHGEEFLDHGGWLHEKDLYEELVHVPLLIKPPRSAGIDPKRITTPVSLIDVAPTVCRLAGVSTKGTPFLGQDLMKLVVAPDEWKYKPILSSYRQDKYDLYSVRRDNLKYIRQFTPEPYEMAFRLDRDPEENENILDTLDEELVEELRATVEALRGSRWNPGLRIDFVGDGVPAEVTIIVRCDNPAIELRLAESETPSDGDWFNSKPIEFQGIMGVRIGAHFNLGGQDRQDGLQIDALPEDRFHIEILLDGKPIDPERILFGAGTTEPQIPQPILLGSDPRLLVDSPPALEERPGTWCHIWRIEKEEVDIDTDTMESLRALGYFGEDD